MAGKKRTLNEQPFLHRTPLSIRRKMEAQELLDSSRPRPKGGQWYRRYLEFTATDEGEKAQALALKYSGAKLAQMQLRRRVIMSEENEIRGWVRKILKEDHNKLLVEQAYGQHGDIFAPASKGELYDIFIKPFARVLKVASIGLRDILTSAKYTWDMATTIDPIKKSNMKTEYKARKERIAAERKEEMKIIDELGGFKVPIAMAMLGPAAVIAALPVLKTMDNREEITDWFREAGFGKPSKKEQEQGAEEPVGIVGTAGKLLGKLRDLFMESPDGSRLISEQKGFSTADIEAAIEEVAPGMLAKFEKGAKEYLESTKEFLDSAYEELGAGLEMIRTVKKAETFDEYIKSIEGAKANGFKLGGPSPQELQAEFEKNVKELVTGENRDAFIEATLETTGKKSPEELSEAQLIEAAKKAIFASSTEKIRDDLDKVERGLLEHLKEVMDGQRPMAKDAETLKQTEAGREYLGFFDEFDRKVLAIK